MEDLPRVDVAVSKAGTRNASFDPATVDMLFVAMLFTMTEDMRISRLCDRRVEEGIARVERSGERKFVPASSPYLKKGTQSAKYRRLE